MLFLVLEVVLSSSHPLDTSDYSSIQSLTLMLFFSLGNLEKDASRTPATCRPVSRAFSYPDDARSIGGGGIRQATHREGACPTM